ncbi:MAG: HlyD family secretion protein [Myxococcaceae bacterium]|nr:HlyD family secretion protein [Myxococcaceae bacterium]
MESSIAARSPTADVRSPEAPPAQAAAARRGRRAFVVLGGLVAAAALATGVYALATANQETTDDAQVEADVVPIAARVGGAVQKVHVEDNAQVKKGQLLVELDSGDFAARLEQAQAELMSAKAQLAIAEAQAEVVEATAKGGFSSARAMVSGSSVAVSSAAAQVEAAKAALERARAEARRAELDLERTQKLYAAQAAPKQMLDNAQLTHDAAQAALAQAEAALAAAEEQRRAAQSRVAEAQGRLTQTEPIDAQISAARAQAELARARVKAAIAAVTLAENQLSYTRILAPDDGTVSKLSVHEGQLISPGAPIAELVPAHTWVVANFKETQIGRMRPGQRATISVDAFGGRELEGRVESLSAGTGARFSLLPPDNASGNFVKVVQRVPVRIALVDPPKDFPLRAGLSAEVTIYLK